MQAFDAKFCAGDVCFNELTERQKRNGNKFCSKQCAGRNQFQKNAKQAGDALGNKRRGKNPNIHIQVRVDGQKKYLHRVIVERQLGVKLDSHEVVHHKDHDKHHNCFWKDANACERCRERGEPNLEVLTGQDAHMKLHNEARRNSKRK
jgi:hypothetical protein